MANSTVNREIVRVGPAGHTIQGPVKGSSHLYAGTLIAQLASGGMFVPGSTASSGAAVGVAQHEVDTTGVADDVAQIRYETDSDFVFANDGTNPFVDATLVGSVAYMVDDHTVSINSSSGARFAGGLYQGLTADGGVRVHVTTKMPQIMAATAS